VKRLERSSSRETTHISVVDSQGNAVALTHTLGSPSGAITDGLGFMYNGTMSRFDPRPGKAASIAPGKRRLLSRADHRLQGRQALHRDGRARRQLSSRPPWRKAS
jgi:gamma-glutamyltranspeptidase/glutathione hydrolase